MAIKIGWKSSEFGLSVLGYALAGTSVVLAPAFAPVAAILATAGGIAYTISRTMLKIDELRAAKSENKAGAIAGIISDVATAVAPGSKLAGGLADAAKTIIDNTSK